MLFWHVVTSRTRSVYRERICSLGRRLVKLPTFIDTPILTGESKGKGARWERHRSRVPLGTCRTTNLLVLGCKIGQIYARVGDCVATWFGSRELGWPKLITFLEFLSFTVTHIDIAFIISQRLDLQLPKGRRSSLQPYTKNSTIVSEKSKPSRLTFDLKAPRPSNAVAPPFPLFRSKLCNEKLHSTRQLSYYIKIHTKM